MNLERSQLVFLSSADFLLVYKLSRMDMFSILIGKIIDHRLETLVMHYNIQFRAFQSNEFFHQFFNLQNIYDEWIPFIC